MVQSLVDYSPGKPLQVVHQLAGTGDRIVFVAGGNAAIAILECWHRIRHCAVQ